MRMPKPKAGAFSRALVDLIETRLRALRLSVHAAEKRYGFPPESLRSVLKGSSPSVDRFKKICDALEIDFTLGATLDATPLGATPLGSTLGETPLGATPLGATLPTKLPTNFGGKVGGKVGGIVGGIVGGKVVRGRKGLGHAGRMGGREDGGKIDSCSLRERQRLPIDALRYRQTTRPEQKYSPRQETDRSNTLSPSPHEQSQQ